MNKNNLEKTVKYPFPIRFFAIVSNFQLLQFPKIIFTAERIFSSSKFFLFFLNPFSFIYSIANGLKLENCIPIIVLHAEYNLWSLKYISKHYWKDSNKISELIILNDPFCCNYFLNRAFWLFHSLLYFHLGLCHTRSKTRSKSDWFLFLRFKHFRSFKNFSRSFCIEWTCSSFGKDLLTKYRPRKLYNFWMALCINCIFVVLKQPEYIIDNLALKTIQLRSRNTIPLLRFLTFEHSYKPEVKKAF